MSAIPHWAVPGAKVVCVVGKRVPACVVHPDVVLPVDGAIYTLREVVVYDGEAYALLVEIVNPIGDYDEGRHEPCFHLSIFRPAVDDAREVEAELYRKHGLHKTLSDRLTVPA